MQTDIVLQKLDTARTALAEAKTIQETKRILDVAAAAEVLAKRQKLGEEAILYATSIKVEALAQLGRMLKETPKAIGGNYGGRKRIDGTRALPSIDVAPTLAEMGLDKKTSKLAQDVAALPEEQLEAIKRGVMTLNKAQKKVKEKVRYEQRAELVRLASRVKPSERWQVWQADIRTWNAPQQYDFIITDPPYPKEYLPLYSVLAKQASQWLKPGGLLIAMSAHYYMNRIYPMMDEHLDYFWTSAYLVPGESAGVFLKKIIPQWKPLIMYNVKGHPFKGKQFADVFKSLANDKEHHKWGQSVSGMFDIISKICPSNSTILDPFCGAGTTGVAALMHDCIFHGIDIKEENVKISKSRLNEQSNFI